MRKLKPLANPILEFTVSRKKWINANNLYERGGMTYLRNDQGYMCCLGFACKAAGVSNKKITLESTPEDIAIKKPLLGLTKLQNDLEEQFTANTVFTDEAIKINDTEETTQEEKEEALIRLGRKHKIQINFVD